MPLGRSSALGFLLDIDCSGGIGEDNPLKFALQANFRKKTEAPAGLPAGLLIFLGKKTKGEKVNKNKPRRL